MKLSTSVILPLLPALSTAAVIRRQNGDGPQGGADSTQGDLGARPLPRFPFPVTKFPVPTETVVLNETMYIGTGNLVATHIPAIQLASVSHCDRG